MGNKCAKRKRDTHKQVESGDLGNTSEQSEPFLKASIADHQGRLTEVETFASMIFAIKYFSRGKKSVFAILMINRALESGLRSNEFFFDSSNWR